jgi:hypothetical protein
MTMTMTMPAYAISNAVDTTSAVTYYLLLVLRYKVLVLATLSSSSRVPARRVW